MGKTNERKGSFKKLLIEEGFSWSEKGQVEPLK
jgi:hypothetical protein